MRVHRFLVDQALLGSTLTITDTDLLHQWTRVLRYEGTEEVILIDGRGNEVRGRLTSCSPKEATVEIKERKAEEEVELPTLTLYFSPLKRDLTELILQKGTELGVTAFQPIICDRTVRDGYNAERSARILKEATEQSGRFWLPTIEAPISFNEAVKACQAEERYFASLVLESDGEFDLTCGCDSQALFVGPEGGWSGAEENAAETAKFRPIRLSKQVLRAETACIAGIALLRAKIA